jgi:hypothetical protein
VIVVALAVPWLLPAETMAAPLSSFSFGMFDDFNVSGAPARVERIIRDIRGRGFNAMMWTNGSVANQDAALAVSDRLNFPTFLGPAGELNQRWWDPSVPATLGEARRVINPLVDRLKRHPSLKGYYTIDEPGLDLGQKLQLATRVFRERDPSRSNFPLLGGVDRVEPLFAAAGPDRMVIDVYPYGIGNPPCDTQMTGFGYTDRDFVAYVREVTRVKPFETPLWIILQTHGVDWAGLREPTVPEVRKEFWLALGEGANGVFWFVYSSQQGWTGLKDNSALYEEVTALAKRTNKMQAKLSGTHRVDDRFTASPGAYVSTRATVDRSRVLGVLVNPSCSPQEVSVRADVAGSLRNIETGRRYAQGAPIRLAAGDGMLFELE